VNPEIAHVETAHLDDHEFPDTVNAMAVQQWFEAISERLSRSGADLDIGFELSLGTCSRSILRFPFCDKKTMAVVLIGMASARTRVNVVGGFLSGGKEKAKGIMIKVFDQQGLFGLNKVCRLTTCCFVCVLIARSF
jgi:hypothetical protein